MQKTTSAMASRHSGGTDLMGAQCHDKSIQLWFHSRLTIGGYSSSKKYDHLIRVQTEIICFATYTYYYTTHSMYMERWKKAIFSDIALGGLSGELSWMLFFFLAKTKTTTREPFFSPLKLALLFLPSSAFFLFYFYEVRFTHDWTLLPIAKIEAALARVVQVSI